MKVLEKNREIDVYRNIPTLKAPFNDHIKLTKREFMEWMKCANDPIFFIRKYVKIIHVDKGLVPFNMYDFQEEMVRTYTYNRFAINLCPRQVGKALSVDTPILTSDGWKPMSDVDVGDYVYGRDGKLTKVIFTSPIREDRTCYKLEFDNDETIIADENHLWTVDRADWSQEKVMTTKEIIDFRDSHNSTQPLKIKINQAVQFEEQDFGFDPYIFGLWLGDGYSSGGRISCHIDDFKEYKKNIVDIDYSETSKSFNVKGLYRYLRINNLLNNKHIPKEYIFNTESVRLELIRGLLDSDGWCGKNGRCEFYNKNKQIVDDFRFILSSLGIKSRLREKNINGDVHYRVLFCTEKEVFKLPRKKERQKFSKNHPQNKNYYIKKIEKVESVPVKCIGVDNEDHLFLAGKTLIPTHNSTTAIAGWMLWYILFQPARKCCILAHKASTARELLSRLQLAYEHIPLWMQQGVKTWNKGSIEIENGSSVIAASTSSASIRGMSFNCVFLDEFAFVPDNIAEDFFASTYPTISSGEETKVIIVSTPNGMNHFYKMWMDANKKEGEKGKSNFIPIRVYWQDVPGRDEKWKQETIANTSERQFDQEHECSFLGSSNTLISSGHLKNMPFFEPEYEKDGLKVYDYPEDGHEYVMTVDSGEGLGMDYSALSVFDVTEYPYKQVAVYRDNEISHLIYPNVIYKIGKMYNDAYTLFELNSIGGEVANIFYHDLEYEEIFMVENMGRGGQQISSGMGISNVKLGIKQSPATKNIGCSNLKSLIEDHKLIIKDFETISELTTFVQRKKTYMAEEGKNDDLAMTLVLFAWLTNQQYFKDMTDKDVRKRMFEMKQRSIEEDMLPMFFDDGIDDDLRTLAMDDEPDDYIDELDDDDPWSLNY